MQIETDQIYHIYNRGVDKRNIFADGKDFVRFIRSMRDFNSIKPIGSLYEKKVKEYKMRGKDIANPLWVSDIPSDSPDKPSVEFISYCLLNNHYHFLLKQLADGGISEFMRRLGIGYTNYFNKKCNRSGSLFEGKYKIIKVNNYSHFLKLAVYVNCNSEVHKISLAKNWPWSSFLDYIGKRKGTLCDREIIINEFKNSVEFENFCLQVLPGIIEMKDIKRDFLE